MEDMRKQAFSVINKCIKAVLPDESVESALKNHSFHSDNIYVISVGKAAWNMANAAKMVLGDKIKKGIVITKYEHSKGEIAGFEIIEAGHPIPDENSVVGTNKIVELVSSLSKDDEVVFLISGGGSALFESPMLNISLQDIVNITEQLMTCGANIIEMNTIRKRLSKVKGGRFAELCAPANIVSIVLSDVIGDKLQFIASGPCVVDSTTTEDALDIIEKYKINITPNVLDTLKLELPKNISNCETVVTGSVKKLCETAAIELTALGYTTYIISTTLETEAKDIGKLFGSIAKEIQFNNQSGLKKPCAIIAGGETVVKINGNGKGGRNQELALSCAIEIDGIDNVVLFSFGSDGTDGPTDAAGGIVDGKTVERLNRLNLNACKYLKNNDSYNALKQSGDLIITGATGTNVNDLIVLICK